MIFHCVGGRGQVDDAAASVIGFALRRAGLAAESWRHGDTAAASDQCTAIDLLCYASYPSEAVRRYAARKFMRADGSHTHHLVIDYGLAAAGAGSSIDTVSQDKILAGDLVTLCRFAAQCAASLSQARKPLP